MSSPLPAPSIQRCNYRSAGKKRKPSSTTRFFCIKTAGRGSLKRGSGQHSFGFPRTSEFGLSPHPDYVLKWRKKPCALLDFAQELCLRGSGFAFLRRAAARVGLSGSGASRFPSEKVLKTALKLPLAYIDSVQYACLPWKKLNLGRGSARWKCWLLAIPRMSMTTFVPRRFPVTMFRSWRPTRRAATGRRSMRLGKSCCSTWTRLTNSTVWSTSLPISRRIPRPLATSSCCAPSFELAWVARFSCCL